MTAEAIAPLPGRLRDPGDQPFVGRHREIEKLESVWEAVEGGERQVVFLGGEPGSGKTRLAAEMAKGVSNRGAFVLAGATSADLSFPYEPLVEAVDQLMSSVPEGAISGLIPDSASELLRLTPSVRRQRPDLGEPSPTEADNRRELFQAYRDLLVSLSNEAPVFLLLEDLHWSSAPTQLMVRYLVENTTNARVLLLATMRTTAPDRSEDLSHTIADLYRFSSVSRIDLPGLDLEDIAEYLVAVRADRSHIPEAASILRDRTGGNPFYVKEMWHQLSDMGDLQSFTRGTVGTPQSITDTIERRLDALETDERRLLEHASALGRAFDIRDLITGARMTDAGVANALDRAEAMDMVQSKEAPGRYEFTHELIRQTLLDSMSGARRATAFLDMAQALETHFASDDSLAPTIARLYAGSPTGHEDKTVEYLEKAAAAATRSLAHEEAASHLEKAAETVRNDRRRTDELLLKAARCHLLAGDFSESRRLYRKVNDSDDLVISLEAAIGYEEASWRPGAVGHEARALLEAALGRVEVDRSNPLHIRALAALGRAHTFSGDIAEGERLSQEALALARERNDPDLIAEALVASLLSVMTRPTVVEARRQEATELRELVMKSGDYDRLGPAGSYYGYSSYLASDHDGWQNGWRDLRLAHEKTGQPFWRWIEGCYRFCDEFMKGQFPDAMETAESIRELGQTFGADDTDGPYGVQMYMVRRELGLLEAVRPLVPTDPSAAEMWLPGLISLYTELEMRDQARSLLSVCLDLAYTTRDTAIHPAVAAFTVEAAVFLQDIDAVRRLSPVMEEYAETNLLVGQCVAVLGSGDRFLGRMSALTGDLEAARSHLEMSLEMDLAIGSRVHEAETRAHLASVLGRMGDGATAARHRSAALKLARSMGQERVIALLAQADDSGAPDGLTSREVEVLKLLSRGASNKEIGDELFISQNTAANHVRSILIKTSSANRTAAAVYAAEKGLLEGA